MPHALTITLTLEELEHIVRWYEYIKDSGKCYCIPKEVDTYIKILKAKDDLHEHVCNSYQTAH